MPVLPLFQFFNNQDEQRLLDDLISESIQIYGSDVWYIPRILTNYDPLYGTDVQSTYQDTYLIEMYLKNVSGFEGDKSFMSKFGGLEIRDQIVMVVSKSTFQRIVTPYVGYDRPHEGDLIFYPLNNKCFQVKFVNPFQMYYPLGVLYVFELTCELFEYSDQIMNTGISAIDILQTKFSTNALDYAILTENGQQLVDENNELICREQYTMEAIAPTSGDNELLQQKGINLIDFTEKDPFSEGQI